MAKINYNIEYPQVDLRSKCILQITVGSTWSANEFSQLLKSVDVLYKCKFWTFKVLDLTHEFLSHPLKREIEYHDLAHSPLASVINSIRKQINSIGEVNDGSDGKMVILSLDDAFITDALTVHRITYASPGFTDFFGVSGILKELREAIVYYFPNQKDKQQAEMIRQQKIELQIKNLKAIGFTDLEIRSLILKEDVQLNNLANFKIKGMIDRVDVIENAK
jgi:hypothetical protein